MARTFRERPRAERAMQGGGSGMGVWERVYHRCWKIGRGGDEMEMRWGWG